MRFLGRENLFGNAHGLVGQVLSRVGAFPIKRDAADRTAIKRATRMLKSNEIVGIMPEGTRRGKAIARLSCTREPRSSRRWGTRPSFP